MKEDKKVTASINFECWKQLKILAVQKEVNLQAVVKEILERSMLKKIKAVGSNNSFAEQDE